MENFRTDVYFNYINNSISNWFINIDIFTFDYFLKSLHIIAFYDFSCKDFDFLLDNRKQDLLDFYLLIKEKQF